jgi:IS4 transposase
MICVCLKAHKQKHYHLGIKQLVNQTTLTRANESRDWRIFADFGNYLISKVQPLYADYSVPNLNLDNEIYVLDTTSISVSINLLTWAEGKYSRGAVKMHTLLNLRGNIPEFIWITDGKCHDSNALDLINFYANAIYLMDNRWQIEVFFKWIKQNLVIKKLWGHSENSVKVHLWMAVIAYLLVAYIKETIKSDYSIYEIMQILGISAFDKTPIRELLTVQRQLNQNVKELKLF